MGVFLSRRLILASASPRRAELLRVMGLAFEIIPSRIDESATDSEKPQTHVARLAETKARAVAEAYPDTWILGADTVVVIDGEILGKPADTAEAKRMLAMLRGRTHEVHTGFALLDARTGETTERVVESLVTFRDISDDEIAWYVSTPEPYDKAGSYAVQGQGAFFIKAIHGSYTNVMGLPLCEVIDVLKEKKLLTFS